MWVHTDPGLGAADRLGLLMGGVPGASTARVGLIACSECAMNKSNKLLLPVWSKRAQH